MRSRILIAGLCAAALLSTAAVAIAANQPVVFTGRSIPPEQIRAFTVTTDTSLIVEIQALANNTRTDLDIMVTTEVDGEEEVVVDSQSGVLQFELASVGLLGATTYKVTVTNVAGPSSKWTLVMTSPGSVDASQGARFSARALGTFSIDGPVDPEFAELQRLVRERTAHKRGR